MTNTWVPSLALVLAALAPAVAPAQGASPSRRFENQVRVRVAVAGLDSTEWFAADVRHTAEGCELIQLRNVAWVDGRAHVASNVEMDDRAVVPPRRVREIQTRAKDGAPWEPVDLAWFKEERGKPC